MDAKFPAAIGGDTIAQISLPTNPHPHRAKGMKWISNSPENKGSCERQPQK